MANKKKAAKKTTKKSTTPRGHAYEFTAKKMNPEDLGPQAKVVHDTLMRKQPATVHEIADACGGKLNTTQGAVKVVGFYLVQWKGDGYVRFVKKEKAPKKARKTEQAAAASAA